MLITADCEQKKARFENVFLSFFLLKFDRNSAQWIWKNGKKKKKKLSVWLKSKPTW